jgi:hypothetical protein
LAINVKEIEIARRHARLRRGAKTRIFAYNFFAFEVPEPVEGWGLASILLPAPGIFPIEKLVVGLLYFLQACPPLEGI